MGAVKPSAKQTKAGNEKRATDCKFFLFLCHKRNFTNNETNKHLNIVESMDAAAEAAKKAVRKLDAGADTMQVCKSGRFLQSSFCKSMFVS